MYRFIDPMGRCLRPVFAVMDGGVAIKTFTSIETAPLYAIHFYFFTYNRDFIIFLENYNNLNKRNVKLIEIV